VTLSAFSLLSFAGRIAGIASRLPLARLPGLILHAFERASIEPALRDSKLTEDDPDTGYLYVPGTIRTSVFSRVPSQYSTGQRYTNGTQAP
jgi:hypothetical protein